MELVDRYVSAVGRRLPARQREDIEVELRSLIMDALDERTGEGEPSQEDVVLVLRELGPPHQVAYRYAPAPRYLIGPEIFDTYVTVLGVVLAVTALGLSVALAVDMAVSSPTPGQALSRILSSLISGSLGVIGSITLVFAILERVLPQSERSRGKDKNCWDPRHLPAAPRGQEVRWTRSLANVSLAILSLILLNLVLHQVGLYHRGEGDWIFTPILNPQAISLVHPYLNLLVLGIILHHLVLLARGGWTRASRVFALLLGATSVALLVHLALISPVDPQAFLALGGDAPPETLITLGQLVAGLARWGLAVAAIATLVDMVAQIRALLRGPSLG